MFRMYLFWNQKIEGVDGSPSYPRGGDCYSSLGRLPSHIYSYLSMLVRITLPIYFLYPGLYLYLWAVVFSHYLDVRDEEERGRYRKAPYRR